MKKSPYTDDELNRLKTKAAEQNKKVLYAPSTNNGDIFSKIVLSKDTAGI